MARGITYRDAVLLLGGTGSRTVAALDALAGGALLAATPWAGLSLVSSLFDQRSELARLSRELVDGLADRLRGLGRFDRTQRVEAAHAVIVLGAFFSTASEAIGPAWNLTGREQLKLAGTTDPAGRRGGRFSVDVLKLDLPCPTPQRPSERVASDLRKLYEDLGRSVADFLPGLAPWDVLTGTEQAELARLLVEATPRAAVARYRAWFLDLAAECPEVALWAERLDHEATRQAVADGVASLQRAMEVVGGGGPPQGYAAVVARAGEVDLDRPILSSGDVPDGLVIPSLREGYVDPRCRVADVTRSTELIEEAFWARRPVRGGIGAFLAGHLTHPQATRAPLLVLGQPGSGKSVLTRVLAANLPASDYLVVRVPLREVTADADLQTQLESAVRQATGEAVTWPQLARSAGGALCVVILDGFDELLQATGIGQSDYLERVTRFQQREAELGRPVAVIVTSRIAVADRARSTPGTVAVRLEQFGGPEVRLWLEIWNRLNGPVLLQRGLQPLSAETALRFPDLASQPLLLVMLALYDFDGNALQGGGGQLGRIELYERLLVGFARREVAKTAAGQPDEEIARLTERELERLSLVAFAMFNRGRQWATELEVAADLRALRPGGQADAVEPAPAVGRFFFVHESRAARDGQPLRTFEFLHATFAEYLIGRLVAREAAELADAAERAARRDRVHRIDDAFLHALLSHAPLAQRAAAIVFLKELVDALPPAAQAGVRGVAITLFHGSLQVRADATFDTYAPARLNVPARHAMWSANLVLLAAFAGEITAKELFPGDPELLYAWRDVALLWRGWLGHNTWNGVLEALRVERIWQGAERDLRISYAAQPPRPVALDPDWTYNQSPAGAKRFQGRWRYHRTEDIHLHAGFVADRRVDVLAHAVEPLHELGGSLVTTFLTTGDGRSISGVHALLRFWVVTGRPAEEVTADELFRAYHDLLQFVVTVDELRPMFLRQVELDRERLPADFVSDLRQLLPTGHPTGTAG